MTARREEKWHAAPKFVVKLDIRLHDILQKLRKGRGDGRSERAVHIAVCTLLDSVTHSPGNGRAIPFEFDVVLHNNWRKTWRINRQCPRGLSVLVQPLLLPAVFDRFLNLLGKLVEFAIDGEDACVRRGLLDGVDAALKAYLDFRPKPKTPRSAPRTPVDDDNIENFFRDSQERGMAKGNAIDSAIRRFDRPMGECNTIWGRVKKRRQRSRLASDACGTKVGQ